MQSIVDIVSVERNYGEMDKEKVVYYPHNVEDIPDLMGKFLRDIEFKVG